MATSRDARSSYYLTRTLQHALKVAFATLNEKEKKTAIAIVGVVLKHTRTARAIAIVTKAIHATIARDLVVANLLYDIHVNWGTDNLRPASLIRLARRAHEARALETLASVLSILANRPSTLVDVEKEWLTAALTADLEAGHSCRAATLSDILAAWPSPDKLATVQKVRAPGCECD